MSSTKTDNVTSTPATPRSVPPPKSMPARSVVTSTPATPRSAPPPKSMPARSVVNKGLTSSTGNSADGCSAQRSKSAPVKTLAPQSSTATAKDPRVRASHTNDGRKTVPNVRPPPIAGQKGREAHPHDKSTIKKQQAEAFPPRPEAVPLSLGVKMDGDVVKAVEIQTRGQSENPDWFSWRQNRITASTAHRISHSRFVNGGSQTPPASYLAAIMGEGPNLKTRAMTWGIEHEAEAVRRYQSLKSKALGRAVRVQECGLFIDPQRAWLAASPDGIVEDKRSGERLLCLEVKCPYKHRESTVSQACQEDRAFCLELCSQAGDEVPRYRLKPGHSYYTQVQCQMAVTGIHKSDLVVFTLRETAIVPVTFDPEFWKHTETKLELFYRDGVLPCLRENGHGIPPARPEE